MFSSSHQLRHWLQLYNFGELISIGDDLRIYFTKTEIQSMKLTVFINVNDVISNNYERVFLCDKHKYFQIR